MFKINRLLFHHNINNCHYSKKNNFQIIIVIKKYYKKTLRIITALINSIVRIRKTPMIIF